MQDHHKLYNTHGMVTSTFKPSVQDAEAEEALRIQRQSEIHIEFQFRLGYSVRICIK